MDQLQDPEFITQNLTFAPETPSVETRSLVFRFVVLDLRFHSMKAEARTDKDTVRVTAFVVVFTREKDATTLLHSTSLSLLQEPSLIPLRADFLRLRSTPS